MPRIILRVPKRLRLAPRALLATMRKRPAQVTEDSSATLASPAVAVTQNDVAPVLVLLSHSATSTTKPAPSRSQANRGKLSKELTKDALLLGLEALAQSADAFPPLKSAVGGLLFFVTQVEMVSSNKEDVQRIYAHIDVLAASLAATIPDATELSPAVKHAIRALADDVQAVCVDMRTIARQRRLVRFLRAKRNRAQLQALLKQLEDSNASFVRTVLVSAEVQLTQIVTCVKPMRDDVICLRREVRVFFFNTAPDDTPSRIYISMFVDPSRCSLIPLDVRWQCL